MSATDCHHNIIGLSRTACPCLDGNIPADADESRSGLYLDEAPWVNINAVSAATSDCQELWTVMQRARENAIRDMKTDVLAELRTNAKPKVQPARGIIGEYSEANRVLTADTAYQGVMLHTAEMRGGYMTVHRIGVMVDTSGPISVQVYGREGYLSTYNVVAEADEITWLSVSLELPLWDDAQGSPRYWFVWQPDGEQAWNTRVHCNCPGKMLPRWNEAVPCCGGALFRNEYAWANWAMATGVKGDVIGNRTNWKKVNETGGIVLDVSFRCDMSTVICAEHADYSDPLMMEQARAVLAMASFYLLSFIRTSANVNRFVLLEGEEIMNHARGYKDAYRAHVAKVAELFGSDINVFSDCLACPDPWGFAVKTIHP